MMCSVASHSCWPADASTVLIDTVPDPAAFEGPDEEKVKLFIETALVLRRRIELMLTLPFDKLDESSLQRAMRDIGTQ
jgi:arsenate reductase